MIKPEDIEVREEWVNAARDAFRENGFMRYAIAAVLAEIANDSAGCTYAVDLVNTFLKPKPQIPEAIKGMMWAGKETQFVSTTEIVCRDHDKDILAAYAAGKAAGKE